MFEWLRFWRRKPPPVTPGQEEREPDPLLVSGGLWKNASSPAPAPPSDTPPGLAPLLRNLTHDDPVVRREAAEALGRMGPDAASGATPPCCWPARIPT